MYFSLQLELMNALHFRGDSGERGTYLPSIETGKMKNVLRLFLCGTSTKELHQLHLHIDDPKDVIPHKYAEQKRRDMQSLNATRVQRKDLKWIGSFEMDQKIGPADTGNWINWI